MSDEKLVYPCEIREVYSGDDLIALIDLRVEGLFKRQRIRLHGVDTPNAVGAARDTEAGSVRQEVRDLTRGRRARFTVVSTSRNNGSWVGELVVEADASVGGAINVNQYLIERGYVFRRV